MSLSGVKMVLAKSCAFVTYVNRADCEEGARLLHNNLAVNGTHLKLTWGKRKPDGSSAGGGPAVLPPPGMGRVESGSVPAPPPPGMAPPPGVGAALYPSQDPRNLAAKLTS